MTLEDSPHIFMNRAALLKPGRSRCEGSGCFRRHSGSRRSCTACLAPARPHSQSAALRLLAVAMCCTQKAEEVLALPCLFSPCARVFACACVCGGVEKRGRVCV